MRKRKQYISGFLMFLILFLIPVVTVKAVGNNRLLIKHPKAFTSGRTYKIWNITDYYKDNPEDFNNLSPAELDSRFKGSVSSQSDINGVSEINNLDKGIYIGGEIDKERNSFSVTTEKFYVSFSSDGGVTQTVEVKSSELELLTIYLRGPKYYGSAELIPLQGGVFRLYSSGNTDNPILFNNFIFTTDSGGISDLVTDSEGFIRVKVPVGKYDLVQISAPGEYIKSETLHVEVQPLEKIGRIASADTGQLRMSLMPGETQYNWVNVYNELLDEGFHFFRKVSSSSPSEGLPGAEFKVATWDGKNFQDVLKNGKPYTLKSDGRGFFKAENLKYGTYYLIETSAPVYRGKIYKPLTEAVEFKVDSESSSGNLIMEIGNEVLKEIPDVTTTSSVPETPSTVPDSKETTVSEGGMEKPDDGGNGNNSSGNNPHVKYPESVPPVPKHPSGKIPLPFTGNNYSNENIKSGIILLISGFLITILKKRKKSDTVKY